MFDATAGIAIGMHGGVWPELGYHYSGMSTRGHFLLAGVGLWTSGDYSVIRYTPALLLGTQGGTALGFRHGLSASMLEWLGLELSHAFVSADGSSHHEIGFQVVTDLLFGLSFLARNAH